MIIAREKIIPYGLAGMVTGLVVALVAFDVSTSFDEAMRGRRSPPPSPVVAGVPAQGYVIPTEYTHGRHRIEAVLTGPNGRAVTVPLILDTGATMIVLPSSMKARLGLDHDSLRSTRSRTAGGTVDSQVGRLASAAVGQAHVDDPAIAFIDDRDFGRTGEGLLGMSFLKHFQLTVLTSPPRIILVPKQI